MDLSTFLAYLGIAVSALFGVWGIYLTIKQRHVVALTFFKDQSIALFDNIVKNLPELDVLYMKNPVTPNLVLFSGALVNTGRKDISHSMVEKPITAFLPKNFKWLTAKVTKTSDNVSVAIEKKDDQTIEIQTGLLRCGEFVRFQALAEVPLKLAAETGIDELLAESVVFDHRIEDAKKISKVNLQKEEYGRKLLRLTITMSVIGILVTLGIAVLFWYKGFSLSYTIPDGKGQNILVSIKTLNENELIARGVGIDFQQKFKIDEFFGRCIGRPKTIRDLEKIKIPLMLLVFTYILVPLISCAATYYRYRKHKNFRMLLSNVKSDTRT